MHKWKPMVLQFKKRLKMTAPAFFFENSILDNLFIMSYTI